MQEPTKIPSSFESFLTPRGTRRSPPPPPPMLDTPPSAPCCFTTLHLVLDAPRPPVHHRVFAGRRLTLRPAAPPVAHRGQRLRPPRCILVPPACSTAYNGSSAWPQSSSPAARPPSHVPSPGSRDRDILLLCASILFNLLLVVTCCCNMVGSFGKYRNRTEKTETE
jgi:hypothetical protein